LWLTKYPAQWIKTGFDSPSISCSEYPPVVAHQVSYPMGKNRFWFTKYLIQWVPTRCGAPSILSKEYQSVVAHQASYPRITNPLWLTIHPAMGANSSLPRRKAAEQWKCTFSSNYSRSWECVPLEVTYTVPYSLWRGA